jgi:hypothetical protein
MVLPFTLSFIIFNISNNIFAGAVLQMISFDASATVVV